MCYDFFMLTNCKVKLILNVFFILCVCLLLFSLECVWVCLLLLYLNPVHTQVKRLNNTALFFGVNWCGRTEQYRMPASKQPIFLKAKLRLCPCNKAAVKPMNWRQQGHSKGPLNKWLVHDDLNCSERILLAFALPPFQRQDLEAS